MNTNVSALMMTAMSLISSAKSNLCQYRIVTIKNQTYLIVASADDQSTINGRTILDSYPWAATDPAGHPLVFTEPVTGLNFAVLRPYDGMFVSWQMEDDYVFVDGGLARIERAPR